MRYDFSNLDGNGADFRRADIRGRLFHGADLRGADLRGVNAFGTSFRGADLRGADLRGANLHLAVLCGADLRGADLRGADLRRTDLRDVEGLVRLAECGALAGTVLDPDAAMPAITDAEIAADGLRVNGAWIYGWRTQVSGLTSTVYQPGCVYTAPVFSVDADCATQPGIAFASREYAELYYPRRALIEVRCLRGDALHVKGTHAWRARKLHTLSASASVNERGKR